MENEIIVKPDTTPVINCEVQNANDDQLQCYPSYEDERQCKLVDEIIAAVKDDRMNTKRAISADIAATAMVQNQNERVIEACERELRRRDLHEERRAELFEIMSRAATSTANESAASREFQKKQLDHSNKLPLKILVWSTLVIILGIGGKACLKGTA